MSYRIRKFNNTTGKFDPDPATQFIRHMAYYLRMVNQYNAARIDILRGRPAKVPPRNRPARLLSYKLALNARIEAERGVTV
ncbi:hypothetical protein [Cohnella phaseoli]|uniref:Uncharacterized protein n=1 Tax=Cohnella phaseoli TaxID=456490 RepID=A0A3D9KI25_9BACL|nr:hypothetical protein [Cohnella phaseoli]RED86191.1 hypothetical protein DFP98_10342 [Cohnella phaseoli]